MSLSSIPSGQHYSAVPGSLVPPSGLRSTLPQQLEGQLQISRDVGAGKLAVGTELGIGSAGVELVGNGSKLRVIQHVECVHPQLQLEPFGDLEKLRQVNVKQISRPRADARIFKVGGDPVLRLQGEVIRIARAGIDVTGNRLKRPAAAAPLDPLVGTGCECSRIDRVLLLQGNLRVAILIYAADRNRHTTDKRVLAAEFPPSDEPVQQPIRIVEERVSAAYGQVVDA